MNELKYEKEVPYTCGFAFNENLSDVLLIKKIRGPSFNRGKWNGIGGHMEIGEGARGCMAREFEEECGISTSPLDWTCFHLETHPMRAEQDKRPRIYFMTTVLNHSVYATYRSLTDEPVLSLNMNRFIPNPVYNLHYLLSMAQVWHRHPEHRWIEG